MHMTNKPKPHTNQGHADPNKGGRDQYKRHVDGSIAVRGEIETHVPQDAAQQHNTEREEDKTRAKKNYIVGVLTLVAVVIYAGITLWQGYLTRQISQTTQKEFAIQQRALVQITPRVLQTIDLADIKKLEFPIEIENLGNSTAPRIQVNSVIKVPKADEEPSFDYNAHTSVTHAPLFPKGKDISAAILASGTMQPVELTESTREELGNGKRYLMIYGRIEYEDSFGYWWTQFCGWRTFLPKQSPMMPFATRKCVDYNIEGGRPKTE